MIDCLNIRGITKDTRIEIFYDTNLSEKLRVCITHLKKGESTIYYFDEVIDNER